MEQYESEGSRLSSALEELPQEVKCRLERASRFDADELDAVRNGIRKSFPALIELADRLARGWDDLSLEERLCSLLVLAEALRASPGGSGT